MRGYPLISIHAPPRGATLLARLQPTVTLISIHAPPRGATATSSKLPPKLFRFQFTPLREGRLAIRTDAVGMVRISIHAPPRGATVAKNEVLATGKIFQFTPLREGRQWRKTLQLLRFNFNSRPSARGDASAMGGFTTKSYFNSRPSARGDTTKRYFPQDKIFQFTPLREGRHQHGKAGDAVRHISIHAPPRGATHLCGALCAGLYFNSRPSARGDAGSPGRIERTAYFNSRPSARGDGGHAECFGELHISIHAPPRGATTRPGDDAPRQRISIHAPPRGATADMASFYNLDHISIHAPPRGATE